MHHRENLSAKKDIVWIRRSPMRWAVQFLLLAISSSVMGAKEEYLCKIEKAYTLDENGLSISKNVLYALDTRLFKVDRNSGVITGAQFANFGYEVTVISHGDNSNPFQVFWVVRGSGNTSIRWIEINQWVSGMRKPLRAVVQNWTYTGFCE